MADGSWVRNQANRVTFVMVDAANTEVPGIGAGGLTIEISKNGGAFAVVAGTITELSDGWYSYISTAGEADTVGPVAFFVTGAGAVQQNLEYVVKQRTSNALAFTYTVTNSVTGAFLEGVEVWITTDIAGDDIIWNGSTDAFGVARDQFSDLPFLDAGTYFFWRQLSGFTFDDPDTEDVSS